MRIRSPEQQNKQIEARKLRLGDTALDTSLYPTGEGSPIWMRVSSPDDSIAFIALTGSHPGSRWPDVSPDHLMIPVHCELVVNP